MNTVNIAAYKFTEIKDPVLWQPIIKERLEELGLKGTIILAPEGMNLVLAGSRDAIDKAVDYLENDPLFENKFKDLPIKESFSESPPFRKVVVRIESEIIAMEDPSINPVARRAPAVDAKTLESWLTNGFDDEGREVVMLDTRNSYETGMGTFKNALKLDIETFKQFPEAIKELAQKNRESLQNKTVVSFCTGGIRCEKAVLLLTEELNFKNAYQLEGGILKYLEDTKAEHWQGECFVFDDRIALDKNLKTTEKKYSQNEIGSTRESPRMNPDD